jgi:hypothetical protein
MLERRPERVGLLPDRACEELLDRSLVPCRNSGLAATRLTELGYANVADYHEGKAEWTAAGLPVKGKSRVAA